MKILITSHGKHPCPGGVDTYIRTITKVLETRGHTVDLLCFSNIDILPDDSLAKLEQIWYRMKKELGDKVCSVFLENELLRYTHEELLAHFDVSSYDIIHSQFGITSYAAKRVRPDIPLVGTVHGCFYSEGIKGGRVPLGQGDLFRRFDEYAVSCPETVITVSTHLNKDLPLIPQDVHEVVFNAVDTEMFKPRPHKNNPVKIAASGAIYHHKGYDVLIESLIILKQQGLSFEVTIFGDGDGAAKLKRMAAENHLPVIFRGEVSRDILAVELPDFDIFVQPSRLDNFPFSVIEAMACGCVPVGSRVGGIPDQIDHMKNGILFESENVGELAQAIGLLIKDTSLRDRLGRQARIKAVEQFSLDKMGMRLEEVYKKTISKHLLCGAEELFRGKKGSRVSAL